jgi:hypothetical protein
MVFPFRPHCLPAVRHQLSAGANPRKGVRYEPSWGCHDNRPILPRQWNLASPKYQRVKLKKYGAEPADFTGIALSCRYKAVQLGWKMRSSGTSAK